MKKKAGVKIINLIFLLFHLFSDYSFGIQLNSVKSRKHVGVVGVMLIFTWLNQVRRLVVACQC